ncbi:MAG: phage holin family protein [Leptospira sp.]|nr:phage holin family protein [Leptospira sp.]
MKYFIYSLVLQVLTVIFLFPFIDSQFRIKGDTVDAIIVVLVFGALNFAIRKLILIFTLGVGAIIYYLTLGIAGLVINALVLILIAKLAPNMIGVPGFFQAFLGGALLAFANCIGKGRE